MPGNQKISAGGMMVMILVLCNVIVLEQGLVTAPKWYILFCVVFLLLLITMATWRKKAL